MQPHNNVFVGNLAWATSSDRLREHFGQVGAVIDAEIQCGRDGRSRGFGVVQFDSNQAALAAISKFNETDLDGRIIFVREDRGTRSPKPVGRVAAPKASMSRSSAAVAGSTASGGREDQKVHPSPPSSPPSPPPFSMPLEYHDRFLGRTMRIMFFNRHRIGAPLRVFHLIARFYFPRSHASHAPFNHMQASLWPAQLQRVAMGCSATACRRLSTAPAGVHVSARTVQHWAERLLLRVVSSLQDSIQVCFATFVFVRCDCSPTFYFCNMSQRFFVC